MPEKECPLNWSEYSPQERKAFLLRFVQDRIKRQRKYRWTRSTFELLSAERLARLFDLTRPVVKGYFKDLPPDLRDYRSRRLAYQAGRLVQRVYGSPLKKIPPEARAATVKQTFLTKGHPFSRNRISADDRRSYSSQGGKETYRLYGGEAAREGQLKRNVRFSKPEAVFVKALEEEGMYAPSRGEAAAGQLYFYDHGRHKAGIRMIDGTGIKLPDFFVQGQRRVVEVWGRDIHSEKVAKRMKRPEHSWRPELLIKQYAQVGWECKVYWSDEIENPDRRRLIISEIKNWVLDSSPK